MTGSTERNPGAFFDSVFTWFVCAVGFTCACLRILNVFTWLVIVLRVTRAPPRDLCGSYSVDRTISPKCLRVRRCLSHLCRLHVSQAHIHTTRNCYRP